MKKHFLLLFISLISLTSIAQTKLDGQVVNTATKEPIVGAVVSVKGTNNGELTDTNGRFAIAVKQNDILVISFFGFTTKEMTVAPSMSNITIELEESINYLEEVVVVGYGTQKRVNLTGSIATVDTKKIENNPSVKLSNSLAGRAPGVQIVNTSGFAGATSSVSIRGSFNEPLYVINGVVRDKLAFDNLDPNEVDNISFLKDPSSAAIYGSKAGNGVVLVTTKKGSHGKVNFQYKGSYTFSNPTKPLQDWSAQEEISFLNRVAEYNNSTLATPDPNFKVPYGQNVLDYFADKSYRVNDFVWQNPSMMQHTISADGGSERITYYMMASMTDEKGSYKNVDFSRYNVRSDITAKVTDSFKINLNIGANQNNGERFYWPYDGAEDTNLSDFYRTTFNWSRLYPFYTDKEGNPSNSITEYPVFVEGWNPVEMVAGDRYRKMRNRSFDGSIRLDLSLDKYVKGLSAAFVGNYVASDKNSKAFITHNKSFILQRPDPNNQFKPGPPNPDKIAIHNLSNDYENISEEIWLNNSYMINAILEYKNSFGKHNVSGTFVYEQSEAKSKYLSGRVEGLLGGVDQIFDASSDRLRSSFGGNEGDGGRVSFIGRVNYNYDSRYIAEFAFREDGNDRFAPGHRWGFFPSASMAWRISEEKFFSSKWLNNLKLRLAYGSTGDDSSINPFDWSNRYVQDDRGYMFGDKYYKGIRFSKEPNPIMTWATLEGYDIGVDFGMLDNKLTGEIGVFYRNRYNILQSPSDAVPDIFGRGIATVNYAKQDWKGYEISLRWADKAGDFDYSAYANMGYVVDRWLRHYERANLPAWKSRLGHPHDYRMGFVADGIYRTQADLDALPAGFTQFGEKPRLGMIRYVDIRNTKEELTPDGKITDEDQDYLSRKTRPRINYGFGGNISWKGLTLDLHFQGVGDYDKFISNRNTGGIFQVGNKPYFDIWANGDFWTPQNPNASLPASVGQWSNNYGAAYSTFWKRSGAYLRLKNASLSYNLPKQWFTKVGVNNVQVYVNGTNLFCISDFDYYDVEQASIDSFPVMRSYTFGLSINF